jgi:hypothetical protein
MVCRTTAIASGVIFYSEKRVDPIITPTGSGWALVGVGGESLDDITTDSITETQGGVNWNDNGTPFVARESNILNATGSDYFDIDAEL